METVTFITGNYNKVKELEDYLSLKISHQKINLVEIQSLSLEEVAKSKAVEAYKLLQNPVLVEDSSLVFSALGKLPGPFIKYFFESLDNEGLVKLLNNYESREAEALTCFALADGSGVKTFIGNTQGAIADKPRGENGFGWDAIFIPANNNQTWAEMNLEEKQKTSMRAKALQKLKNYLITK